MLGTAGSTVPGTLSAFTGTVTNSENTVAAKSRFTCADVFAEPARHDTAFFEYTLRDDAGSTVASDSSAAGNPGTYLGSRGRDTDSPEACPADPGASYRLDGGSSRILTSRQDRTIRQNFSVEIWFRTTAANGKLIGFEIVQDGSADHYDKHLYIDSSGTLNYGVYDGNTVTLTSPSAVNDGLWHQAVATTSASTGSLLYLDGVQVASNPNKVLAEDYDGYWRIGQGRTAGWPNAPDSSFFTGSLAFAGAFGAVLSADDVSLAWNIGHPGPSESIAGFRSAPASTAMPAPTATPTTASTPGAVESADPTPTASALP